MESFYAGTIALDNGEPLDISQVVFDIEAINTAYEEQKAVYERLQF